jgi:hypothetical protein
MASIAEHVTFLRRVEYCLKKAAIDVMAELATVDNHAERVAYATKVLTGEASVGEYARAVVTNPTLTAGGDISSPPNMGISDGDLQYTVESMFNAHAGIAN